MKARFEYALSEDIATQSTNLGGVVSSEMLTSALRRLY